MGNDRPYLIREATEDDSEAISALFFEGDALHHQALPDIFPEASSSARTREYVRHLITADDAALLLAESDSRVVGLVEITIQGVPPSPLHTPRRYARVLSLVVAERFRKRGVGTALMERTHRWALGKGVNQIELNVFEFNEAAIRLYEKLGYRTLSRRLWIALGRRASCS